MKHSRTILLGCFLLVFAGQLLKAASDGEELNQYMEEVAERADRQGPLLVSDCGDKAFSPALCHALNLAEQGEFAAAATALSPWTTDAAGETSREVLRDRMDSLRRWSEVGGIDVESYRNFYLDNASEAQRGRLRPVVTLWKTEGLPEIDRYVLLADLLGSAGDAHGQVLALLAIPELPKVEEVTAAWALLGAGNALYESGDLAAAERAWLGVMEYPSSSPAWPKATFNLGLMEEKRASYPKAVDYFERVLTSKPNDAEEGSNLVETNRNYTHRSALAIARCYEALGDYRQALHYALLARDEYVFVSWCGTCAQSANDAVNLRIAKLAAHAYGYPVTAGLGLIVAAVFVRRRVRS